MAATAPAEPQAVWDLSTDLDAEQERRSMVWYGELLPGAKVQKQPSALHAGKRYRILMTDGGHSGHAEFTLGPDLPVCSAESRA